MTIKDIPLRLDEIKAEGADREIVEAVLSLRGEADAVYAEEKYEEALEKVVESLRRLREFSDYGDREFRALLAVLAMELSTRILRSRKKTLELLAKQQINTGVLYEKVNAGVAAATDKLVESLRKGAEMMAQTGDYRGAVRFYMEAIKLAKKRTGRVTRREIRMTVDMAKVMLHSGTAWLPLRSLLRHLSLSRRYWG